MIELSTPTLVLGAARLLSGLLAGLYVAFAIAVMPALRAVTDTVFVTAMNRINDVIVSAPFLLIFFGAPLLGLVMLRWNHTPVGWVAAGAGLLSLVITVAANIPLNEALAGGGTRAAFENAWTIWHAVRTALCTLSFGALLLARVAA